MTGRKLAIGLLAGAALVLGAALAARALARRHDDVAERAPETEPEPIEQESALDAALEASFPASDPVATGIG